MTMAEKQAASNIAAFILFSQFPGKPKGGEDVQLRWSICNTYFPHILRHLDRANESGLAMSQHSARASMHGARYL